MSAPWLNNQAELKVKKGLTRSFEIVLTYRPRFKLDEPVERLYIRGSCCALVGLRVFFAYLPFGIRLLRKVAAYLRYVAAWRLKYICLLVAGEILS